MNKGNTRIKSLVQPNKRPMPILLALLSAACLIATSACCGPEANFELASLSISPSEVVEGSSLVVSVDVTNSGKAEGTFEAKLKIDNTLRETKPISIAAGETETVFFTVDADIPGTHEVKLDGLVGTFSVLMAPQFANLVITPTQAKVGEHVAISADINNAGEISGNYTITLKIDGVDEESKTMMVNAGGTETALFTVTKNTPGIYNIAIGDLIGTLVVCGMPPTLYVGDQWIYRQIEGGMAYTRMETITDEERIEDNDCYVVKRTFDPPFIKDWMTELTELTEWRDKTTYSRVRQQFSALYPSIGKTVNRSEVYSHQVTGCEWPYKVGNEFTIEVSWEITDVLDDESSSSQTGETVTTFKVTKIEEIRVRAETLTCFKTVAYQGGNATYEYWYSDKAKAYVKHTSLDNGFNYELLSYSVR